MLKKEHRTILLINLALLTTSILWASAFAGIRIALQDFSAGPLALFRYAIASIVMLLLFIFVKREHVLNLKKKLQIFLLGVLGIGIYNIELNHGEISVDASTASFIISLIPVFMVILARALLKEKLNWKIILGIFISLSGIALITLTSNKGIKLNIGVLEILVATIAGACYSIMQKPFLKKLSTIEFTSYAIWGATASLLFFTPQTIREFHQASTETIIAVIYLGIFPAAFAYLLWSYGLSRASATHSSSYLYLMPAIATLIGWGILGETPKSIALIGGSIALLGAIIINRQVLIHRNKT